jgi:hypothetical protein
MTMPHLMNCPHDEDGWCLKCVKKLYDEKEAVQYQLDLAYEDIRALEEEVYEKNEH